LVLKILFFLVVIGEGFLSHQNGKDSGKESRALSKTFHVNEKALRIAAHIFLFACMMFLSLTAFPGTIWPAIGVGVWTVIDEATKPLSPGRHCSVVDILWNMLGGGIGWLIWFLIIR